MVGSQEWKKPREQKYNQARLTLIIDKISPIFNCFVGPRSGRSSLSKITAWLVSLLRSLGSTFHDNLFEMVHCSSARNANFSLPAGGPHVSSWCGAQGG